MYGTRSRTAAEHGMFNHWLIQLARVTHPRNRGGEIGSLKLCKTVQEIFGMFLGLESVGFTKKSQKTALLGRICSCVAHDSDLDHPRANDFMMFFLPMFIWQGENRKSEDSFFFHRFLLSSSHDVACCMASSAKKWGVELCFPVPGRDQPFLSTGSETQWLSCVQNAPKTLIKEDHWTVSLLVCWVT
jgi:hypothetical protein